MNSTDLFLASRTNEDGSPKYPGYTEMLPQINAAIAEQDRVAEARDKAGWDCDPEYGWGCENPLTGESMTETEYIDAGFILPEDVEMLSPDAYRIYNRISQAAGDLTNKFMAMPSDDPERAHVVTAALAVSRISNAMIHGYL